MVGELRINPSARGPHCRCGKTYARTVIERKVSPLDDSVLTRRLDVYTCTCGDCWAHNVNNEPESQS